MGEAMARVRRLTPDLLARDLPAYLAALRARAGGGGRGGRRDRLLHGRPDRGPRRRASTRPWSPSAAGTVAAWSPTSRTARTARSPRHARRFAFGHAVERPVDAARGGRRARGGIEEAGLQAVNEVFPGPHGYSMSDTAMYDEESTERHFASLRGSARPCSTLGPPSATAS